MFVFYRYSCRKMKNIHVEFGNYVNLFCTIDNINFEIKEKFSEIKFFIFLDFRLENFFSLFSFNKR